MELFHMDLHIHTVLSPCAELDMGAPDIIRRCIEEHVDIIAITDHNSSRNSRAVKKAAEGSGVEVICGLEVQSAEDIHVLCLFPDQERAALFEEWVKERLPRILNRPEKFGDQIEIDEKNNIIREHEILLVQGMNATADEIIERAAVAGGLSILAHIDRPVYSYIAVLGMIPGDLKVDAVELSGCLSGDEALEWKAKTGGRNVIRTSDAHRLMDISLDRTTPVMLERPSFREIEMAFKGESGRKILWPWGDLRTPMEIYQEGDLPMK